MIIRTYECLDCLTVFEMVCDSGDASDPECPQCSKVLEWRPGSFSIKTNKSRAMDVAQDILEKDYGMTNFKDNSREGDVAAIIPSETTAQREQRERALAAVQMEVAKNKPQITDAQAEAVKRFWNAGSANATPLASGSALIAAAKAGPRGPDPMKMLHDAKPPFRFRVVARG